jgi:hypothetical protein
MASILLDLGTPTAASSGNVGKARSAAARPTIGKIAYAYRRHFLMEPRAIDLQAGTFQPLNNSKN